MKKILMIFCVLMMLTVNVYASNEDGKIFAPSITVDDSTEGKIVVTVPNEADNADILAEKKPTLSIPCEFENAYVEFENEKIDSSLQDGEIAFVVEKVGDYVIIEGVGNSEIVPPTIGPKPSSGGGGGSSVTRYEVKVQYTEGGTVTPETTKVKRGEDITFEIKTKEGYEIEDVFVDGKSVGNVSTYTFEDVKEKHVLEAKFKKVEVEKIWANPFDDVSESNWFYDAVKFVNEKGLFKGVSETEFAPYEGMTRGMIITVLWRLENMPVVNYLMMYEDVNPDEYYGEAIRWATSEKIVNGYSTDIFDPDKLVSREEIVTILYRYAKLKNVDVSVTENTNILSYEDFDEIYDYAIDAFSWACGSDIIMGKTDTILAPRECTNRAETAMMIMRLLNHF